MISEGRLKQIENDLECNNDTTQLIRGYRELKAENERLTKSLADMTERRDAWKELSSGPALRFMIDSEYQAAVNKLKALGEI